MIAYFYRNFRHHESWTIFYTAYYEYKINIEIRTCDQGWLMRAFIEGLPLEAIEWGKGSWNCMCMGRIMSTAIGTPYRCRSVEWQAVRTTDQWGYYLHWCCLLLNSSEPSSWSDKGARFAFQFSYSSEFLCVATNIMNHKHVFVHKQ